jgi:alkylation response protein AidB-like acyl-CoA dehydrogenase
MDFTLSDEQRQFQQSVRTFARRELAEKALSRAHDPAYPWDVAHALATQGLLGLTIPAEDGGGGGTLLDAVIAIQELAMVCPTSADVFQAGNFGAIRTVQEYATSDQKHRFLPDLLAGRGLVVVGMSESEAGSAVTDLRTTATVDGSDVVISGTKLWSTYSVDATVYLIYVRFGPGTGGIGSVLVERGTPGFTLGPPEAYMSGEQWCELRFDECQVPADNILLGAGGFKKQISGFNVERIGNSARALALGRHAFTLARDHASIRTQFGRPLSSFQGIQWKFAEMAVKLDAAQLLLYRAAASARDGRLPSAYETSIAKYAANTAGFEVANESLQVMGAMGYSTHTLVEYCLRRTRGWMIAGGSLEMLKNRIAESVFDQRFPQRAPTT